MAARASGSPALEREVMKWRPQVEVDQLTPGEILASKEVFPTMFTSLYRTGEISGQLDDTLQRLREHGSTEGHRQLDMFTRMLTTAIILLVMLAIGAAVVMFWLEYYGGMMKSLGE